MLVLGLLLGLEEHVLGLGFVTLVLVNNLALFFG